MGRLWGELRDQYQTPDGTDEERLKQVIAQKMGISPEEVRLPYLNVYDIPESFIQQIKPAKSLDR